LFIAKLKETKTWSFAPGTNGSQFVSESGK